MLQTVRITSKRQITIPAYFYRKLGLERGGELVVSEEKGKIVMEPAEFLVERLAGSVSLPKRLRGKSVDQLIKKAKEEYFSRKR